MKDYKHPVALTCVALALFVSGCTTVMMSPEAEGGPVSYSGRTVQATEEASLEEVQQACVKALTDLGIATTDERQRPSYVEITGRGAADSLIKIKLKDVSSSMTSVRVECGRQSDGTTGIVILRKIRTHLGVK